MCHAATFSESFAGGESLAAPHMNHFLASTHQHWAWGWAGHKCCFSSLQYDLTRNPT